MKNYAQIVLSCVFTWIKVGLFGMLFSFSCIGASLWLLKKSYLSELSFLENVFDSPLPFILLIISVIAVFFYFILAKKITIMTLVNQIWKNKLSGFIRPNIQLCAEKIMSVQSSKLKSVTESDIAKQLTDFIKKDKTISRAQRLVLSYGLKDIDLSADDFSSDDFPQFIALKVENKIQSLTKPPFSLFWKLFFGQLLLLVLAMIFS